MGLHEFKQRLKLAIKIIFGYNIIVYEENTKIVNLVINNGDKLLRSKEKTYNK